MVGMDPKIKIHNTENLSYELSEIACDSFDFLLEEMETYVVDEENTESFYFDNAHLYKINRRLGRIGWQSVVGKTRRLARILG